MQKKLYLGKVDYNGRGRKINAVYLTLELKQVDRVARTVQLDTVNSVTVVSICGEIWNGSQTDCVQCGQCIDTILEFFPGDRKVQRIHDLWKQWHLNDMKAGTDLQLAFIVVVKFALNEC